MRMGENALGNGIFLLRVERQILKISIFCPKMSQKKVQARARAVFACVQYPQRTVPEKMLGSTP